MKAKNNLTILLLFFCITIFAQKKEFSILGKWQETAYSADDGGGKMYTNKIKNGAILFFETNNSVKDNLGNIGTYELKGGRLKIELNKYNNSLYIQINI